MTPEMPTRPGKKPLVQSVELTLSLLENLAASGRAKGVTELAGQLGTTKTRVYRHLQTLVQTGYVVQETETDRYRPGVKLYFLGQSLAEHFDVIAAGRNEAIALRDRWGCSVQISVTLDFKLVILFIAKPIGLFDIGQRVGSTYPVHCSAGGKIYLAFGNGGVDALLSSGTVQRYTKQTLTHRDDLVREINKIRNQGWAVSPNEARIGINAISAPIFNQEGDLEASVALLGSIEEIPAKPPKEMIESVVAVAKQISRNLGWGPKVPSFKIRSSNAVPVAIELDLKRRKEK